MKQRTLLFIVLLLLGHKAEAAAVAELPTLDEAMAAGEDVWGLAAMRQANGASYDFFDRLLPPLRYVNADFHYYPVVLSAPNAPVKARLISNGSGVNLRGGARAWHDNGTPVTFRVGPDEFVFGTLRERLRQPVLAEGWLPIVQIRYEHPTPIQAGGQLALDQHAPDLSPEVYRLEAFASTEPGLAGNGVVFVRFDLAQGSNGYICVEVDSSGPRRFDQGKVLGSAGRQLAIFDSSWRWSGGRAHARLKPGSAAVLAIPTAPLGADVRVDCTARGYAAQREACARTWRELLARGMNLETPEPVVNNAWRNLLVQNFELIQGDSIHYSAGNQYDKLYEAEGSDAALALLRWGYAADFRRLMTPLFDFTRKDLECHQAGFKLLDLCRYYWQTRDTAVLGQLRPHWEKAAQLLAQSRTNSAGLCPKQQYCGDVSTMVYSLTVNAKGWRALRDLSAVLKDAGETGPARTYAQNAARFKQAVLAAIQKSVRRDISPPFVPVALYAAEPPHDPITKTKIGTYWNIVIGYALGSQIFPAAEADWIPRYQEEHGGLCMGMLRAGGGYTFWAGPRRINPLYGTRYVLDTLRRDDPERALVSFYGMLAQGLTRNTFVGAEGSALTPLDDGGRFMYCPPNSAANAHLLSMLRYLLVQDWDLDGDGKPETLRLLFATPRRWLEEGKRIRLQRAPTDFGPVSVEVESHLAQGKILARVQLPQRNPPRKTLLRIRAPEGWQVVSGQMGARELNVDGKGTTDLSGLRGKVALEFEVRRR
jgi:hypothetical protein